MCYKGHDWVPTHLHLHLGPHLGKTEALFTLCKASNYSTIFHLPRPWGLGGRENGECLLKRQGVTPLL